MARRSERWAGVRVSALAFALLLLFTPQQAHAHGYELHGDSPYRFGIPMYIARTMRVGITQPVFECWAHRILVDKAEILVFTRADLEPPDDAAWQQTVAKLQSVDLFIVTENPKQEFAEALLEKAGLQYQRPLIYVDLGVAPLTSQFEDPYTGRTPAQPWFSTNAAKDLMYAMANACMRMDPSNNLEIRRNWQDYGTALQIMKRRVLEARPGGWRNISARCATLRGGPEYLVEESGMAICGVVPPLPDGPIAMAQVPDIVTALKDIRAQVLVTTETLADDVRAAIESGAGVLVCELEPLGMNCCDTRAWDRTIEKDYTRLLDAKEKIWASTEAAK